MASFLDYMEIDIASGDGGDGSASFRREKFVPFGGPDGGDGGDGGNVIFFGTKDMKSLRDFENKSFFKAGNGQNGRSSKRFGKNGRDIIIKVPLGTEIFDLENESKLTDIIFDGEKFVELKRAGDSKNIGALYHTVSYADKDFAALDALGEVLTADPSGYLYKTLVEEDEE